MVKLAPPRPVPQAWIPQPIQDLYAPTLTLKVPSTWRVVEVLGCTLRTLRCRILHPVPPTPAPPLPTHTHILLPNPDPRTLPTKGNLCLPKGLPGTTRDYQVTHFLLIDARRLEEYQGTINSRWEPGKVEFL